MNITKKIISLFLAALMLCGTLSGLSVVTVFADDATSSDTTGNGATGGTTTTNPSFDSDDDLTSYFTTVFATPEDKLASMTLKRNNGKMEIYADEKSGEVAIKNLVTGQVMFTNPYDIASSGVNSDVTMAQLMSQLIVTFTQNGNQTVFNSFEEAAQRGQIKVENIKNGIRVEYTIGREEAKRLVPRWISQDRYESLIRDPVQKYLGDSRNGKFEFEQFANYYLKKSIPEATSEAIKEQMIAAYPVLGQGEIDCIYVLEESITDAELEEMEMYIKAACPEYSYEEMDYDHMITGYEGSDETPPVFKMALEYTLTEDGFSVRLPANGIRFDESLFQLDSISVLPYMGAGNTNYEGYTFYPDGAGALFTFEDLADRGTTVSSPVYGQDYAYHKLSGKYQQAVRYPVFGVVEKSEYYKLESYDEALGETVSSRVNALAYEKNPTNYPATTATEYVENRGFVGIIEEGEALSELVSYHGGSIAPYSSIQMSFKPRPKDSYNIADAISVGSNTEWTVVSSRKYVGNYKIHYVMLTDSKLAAEPEVAAAFESSTLKNYDATWMGMALAYRDYLINKGVLTPLENTNEDIPLYIESFGSVETTEKILSIPVTVKKPLTTFKDVQTMYKELSAAGVKNVNFTLTGFANGGMYPTMPYTLKWENSVSEDMDFQELLDYAEGVNKGEGNLGIFPDFDFSYSSEDTWFDGLSLRKHAVKTIDDRYTSKRLYMATQQKYMGYYQLAISPAYFSHFYEKLMENYAQYEGLNGISVGSLGNALNSDFDEEEPFNREDSKGFVTKALEYFSAQEGVDVMVDGGNAYTWKYVDHILNAPLDSSRFITASYSVPFVGVVLHGYMNYAGSPLNMEGDIDYAKLKAIENGASIYFTLSYQNTQLLKEDTLLSQYYSVRYDIWFDDVVEVYDELNKEMGELQNKYIVHHEFLSGMRVPDTSELAGDLSSVYNDVLDYQNNKLEYETQAELEAIADARDMIASVEDAAEAFIKDCLHYYTKEYDNYSTAAAYKFAHYQDTANAASKIAAYMEADIAYNDAKASYDAADADEKAELLPVLKAAEENRKKALGAMKTQIRNASSAMYSIEKAYNDLNELLANAKDGMGLLQNTEFVDDELLDEIKKQLAKAESLRDQTLGFGFDYTVEKSAVDTFLYTHAASLISQANGDSKAEALYEMLIDGAYGLTADSASLELIVDYLKDDMTEEEIAELKASHDLGKCIRALLADYEFDPTFTDEEIDAYVTSYAENWIYNYVANYAKNVGILLPGLNITTTYFEDGTEDVYLTRDNYGVLTALITKRGTQLQAIKDWDAIAGKDLVSEVLYTDAEWKSIIDSIIDKILDRADYDTPDTMRSDIEKFARAYVYIKAVQALQPSEKMTLKVMTVKTRVSDSVSFLVSDVVAEAALLDAKAADYNGKLYELIETKLALADADLDAILAAIPAGYETTKDNLKAAYRNAAVAALRAAKLLENEAQKKVTVLDYSKIEDQATVDAIEAKLAAAALLVGDEQAALLAEIKADMEAAGVTGSKLESNIASAVNYLQYRRLVDLEGYVNCYYDETMAEMDIAVRALVAATEAETFADVLGALIANDDALAAIAAVVEAKYPVAVRGASITKDVSSYFVYLMLEKAGLAIIGDEPTIEYEEGKSDKDASNAVKNVFGQKNSSYNAGITEMILEIKSSAAAGTVNFTLPAEMLQDAVDRAYDTYMASHVKAVDDDHLRASLETYICYHYYNAVVRQQYAIMPDTADANRRAEPTISVAEIYPDEPLYKVNASLIELMVHFLPESAGLGDWESIKDTFFPEKQDDEEEKTEISKYLSDDGRIVAVSYGDYVEGGYKVCKTFVLNYNDFAVTVKYAGVTYTIPAYDYVVVRP